MEVNMRAVEFSRHAIDRVLNRLNGVVTYGDVQSAVGAAFLRNGANEVTVKRLGRAVVVKDPSAFNGMLRGDTVVAHVNATPDGATVVTVALH
jgi:hypothetical protein